MTGSYQHSECVLGDAQTWQYQQDGYFYRPAGTINGGPEAAAMTEATWLLRETREGEHQVVPDCVAIADMP